MAPQVQGRNIVIAVDNSKDSEYAVRWAIRNHLNSSDKVTLLHVKPPLMERPGPGVFAILASISDSPVVAFNERDNCEGAVSQRNVHEEHVAQDLRDRLASACAEAKIPVETAIVRDADARERICNEAEKRGASTLIMGVRKMGAIKRMLLGSTSDYCVRHAPCPVVVVRPPRH